MNRRKFLKAFSAISAAPYIPVGLTLGSYSKFIKAAPVSYANANFTGPGINPTTGTTVMPQVINVFLYGGPSELAGNLSNINEINEYSQNKYDQGSTFGNNFLNSSTAAMNAGQVTLNNLWMDAGGSHMENMLFNGDMSLYRTIFKRKSTTQSHRESIFMSHKGSVEIEGTPGVGSRLANLLLLNSSAVNGYSLADGTSISSFSEGLIDLPLPFVSFEGETTTYAPDFDQPLPLRLQANTLDEDFDNPYERNSLNFGNNNSTIDTQASIAFNGLVDKVIASTTDSRFLLAKDGFSSRSKMEGLIGQLQSASGVDTSTFGYPNNNFADRVKAAVTLALHNPSSFYITVGGGLGGWDDHNNGVDRYPDRMENVMATMQAAVNHINGFSATQNTINGVPRLTNNNIVINLFGDFGRKVNLNDSNGWDHGNNQNLYTFSGSDLRPNGLGKIVGLTDWVGTEQTNNQYTAPQGFTDWRGNGTATTEYFEPMAIAASTYSYFGAQNTKVLTEGNIDGVLVEGEDPIDETNAVTNHRI